MMRRQTHSAGFSLVETLVAVTVLLVLIVGPMSVTVRSTRSASLATEQATAYFLAQEGLELAQKARDDLLLEFLDGSLGDPWTEFTDPGGRFDACLPPYGSADGCGLVVADDGSGTVDVIECLSDNCRVYRDDSGSSDRARFRHDSDLTQTPYTRTIQFEQVAGREVQVTSVVTWRTGSIAEEQRVTVDSYLFNLYDAP